MLYLCGNFSSSPIAWFVSWADISLLDDIVEAELRVGHVCLSSESSERLDRCPFHLSLSVNQRSDKSSFKHLIGVQN